MSAHWGIPDPAAVEGDEKIRMQAFRQALNQLENRIKIFVSLPIQSLDRLRLQREIDRIGDYPDAGVISLPDRERRS